MSLWQLQLLPRLGASGLRAPPQSVCVQAGMVYHQSAAGLRFGVRLSPLSAGDAMLRTSYACRDVLVCMLAGLDVSFFSCHLYVHMCPMHHTGWSTCDPQSPRHTLV
jgi:hypothetical protein